MLNVAVLPVGGNATRMMGLPKFLLPVNDDEVLIEKHCRGALEAGFDKVVVITRPLYAELLKGLFEKSNLKVDLFILESATSTMNQTLQNGLIAMPGAYEELSITVALADTVFFGENYSEIYGRILNCESHFALGLFEIRNDQLGKLGQVSFDSGGFVLDIRDKTLDCNYLHIWGLAKFPGSSIEKINPNHAHIGITFEEWLNSGEKIFSTLNKSKYFDCGTFKEYRQFLISSS
jgi:dTDP-glucose pyrophosphorylase